MDILIDGKERIKYTHELSEKELAEAHELLTHVTRRIYKNDLDKAEILKEFREENKELKKQQEYFMEATESGTVEKEEELEYSDNFETGQRHYFDKDKNEIYRRPLTPQEKFQARQYRLLTNQPQEKTI